MPGKEAVVEVETNGVVPQPVTKEIPKCGASVEVKGKKDDNPEPVKTTDSTVVPDSATSKPQDTEITSSVEQKAGKEESNNKTEEESNNGSSLTPIEKASTEIVADEGSEAVQAVESKVEASEDAKSSEATPKTDSEVDAKSLEVDTNPADSKVDANSEAAVAESKADPMETEPSSTEKGDPVDTKSLEDVAKPLPANDEKIIVEKDSESHSANPVVTGSDEVKKPGSPQDSTEGKDGSSSVDSSTEKKSESPSNSETKTDSKPGSSSATAEPDLETQISELKKQGLSLYVRKDFFSAADAFGKVLEVAAPLYGEMSEKLAETYFLYGSAMYEYGKAENEVLGEKVKEKDEDDEEEEVEEMEVDDKAEPAAEDSARASTPSGYGENEEADGDAKEPADETIAGDTKEEDDDSFRVAWEMLELAKATFLKADNKKRLADTLIKLGEVGIETDNAAAIDEMVEGLKIRKEIFPETHRIIPETHFTIGIAYAAFDKYDEAIEQFTSAKDCLEKRIVELSKSDKEEDKSEVEEMKSLLPEIQEKIEDTKESKADKEKMKKKIEGELLKEAPFPASSDDKPVSNITHLVKRKRKVDDILPERAAKQSRTDDDVAPTTPEVTLDSAKPADSMESAEEAQMKEPKAEPAVKESESRALEEKDSAILAKTEQKVPEVVDDKPETTEELKVDSKSEEKPEMKTEGKLDTETEEKPKSEEKPEMKTEEKPETKAEENPETETEEKPVEKAVGAESEEAAPEKMEE